MATARRTNHIGDVREAALQLFAERGYRATGIREIARALELGPTSVYSHISSKQDLLRDIVVETCRAIAAEQRGAISIVEDPDEQLRRAAEAHVRYVTRFQRQALVTTKEFMEVEEPALSEVLELRHLIQQTVQELIERGRHGNAERGALVLGRRQHLDGRQYLVDHVLRWAGQPEAAPRPQGQSLRG